jgi:hypothetical protein
MHNHMHSCLPHCSCWHFLLIGTGDSFPASLQGWQQRCSCCDFLLGWETSAQSRPLASPAILEAEGALCILQCAACYWRKLVLPASAPALVQRTSLPWRRGLVHAQGCADCCVLCAYAMCSVPCAVCMLCQGAPVSWVDESRLL